MDKAKRLQEIQTLLSDKPTNEAINTLSMIVVDLEFKLAELMERQE